MRAATKAEVNELARGVFGTGAHAGARRSFTTWWIVEIFDAAGKVLMSANEATLPHAYGDLATRLRARRAA